VKTGREVVAAFARPRPLSHFSLLTSHFRQLYRFIDWLLRLPPELDSRVWLQIKAIEEEQRMTYITTAQRYERAEGVREGVAEGQRRGLLQGIELGLRTKFGAPGVALLAEIAPIEDAARLASIMERILVAATLDEVRAVYAPGA
jgi:hypothetical protein